MLGCREEYKWLKAALTDSNTLNSYYDFCLVFVVISALVNIGLSPIKLDFTDVSPERFLPA